MSNLAEEKRDSLGMFRLPSVSDLAGAKYVIDFVEGGSLTLQLGETEGTFRGEGLPCSDASGALDVVKIRDQTYLIDIDIEQPARDALTVVLSKDTGWALAVHQRRVPPVHLWERGPDCQMTFKVGSIRGMEQKGEAPGLTKDLMGAREFLMMGPENVYEHIYISHEYMVVNHVHTNLARGKAEVQPTTYYKLSDELYVIGVCEMDNATGLVQVVDYANMRMTGKAHHAVDRWKSVSRGLGGQIIAINGKLSYPNGLEPTGFIPDPD